MRRIEIAEHAGFCFGVDRAVKIVYNIIDNGKPAVTYGEIIHNENVVNELKKPGRDFRDDMPKIVVKSDVLKIEDLKENMILTGTVRNVTNFGAFVDIGIKGDGLVHISQISDKFVKNPMDELSVGDIVKVKVISIDLEKNKVALSMKNIKED